MDLSARLFDAAAIDADMSSPGPALRQRPALGEAQEEQELVDAQVA
jgi:hypothetical protein